MNLRLGFVIAGVLVALAVKVVAAAESDYRLAGIAGRLDNLRAFIVWRDGGQRWYREGDLIEGAEVLEISADWVRLKFPEGERLIRPTFSISRSLGVSPFEHLLADAVADVRTVESTKTSQELIAGLSRSASATSSTQLTRTLNTLFELPRGSKVLAVGQENIAAPKDAIELVLKALRQNRLPHVWATSPEGPVEVYLSPRDESG